MAERRMFSKAVTRNDTFIDMPLTTQALYFHLGMEADDDGFLSNAKVVQRMIGASDDDLKLLFAKGLLIHLGEGNICVIRHWKLNNKIQKDRYHETIYLKEKSMLYVDENKTYQIVPNIECIQDVSKLDTQYRIGEIRLVENSSEEHSVGEVKEGACEGKPLEPDLYTPQADLEFATFLEAKRRERSVYKRQGVV